MMPEGLATEIDLGSWPVLRIFEFYKKRPVRGQGFI